MPDPIPPLRQGNLPEIKKSFWLMIGPGAVMVGLAVGSGELVLWPWITARFGLVMVWAPLLAVFLQCWFNIEVGRWAIATGESALNGIARASMKIIYLFLAFSFILTMLPGWGRLTAATLRFFIFGSEGPWSEGSVFATDWLWTLPITAAVWIVLLGPKKIYSGVERAVMVMVLIIFAGMIIVAFKIGTAEDVGSLAGGIASFPPVIVLESDFDFLRFFGAFVFAGNGGFGILFYSYYLRDKGIGMGQRFPMLEIDIRGKKERANETGYLYEDTPENARRFRAWKKYVNQDIFWLFGLTTVVTLLLFMFASFVVLHPQPLGFGDSDLIWTLSTILGSVMGTWGRYLFLVIAMAALFSTILANTDGGLRMWTDMIQKGFASTRKWSPGQMFVPILLITWPIGFFSLWYFETHGVTILDFFFINAAINGIVMTIIVPTVLYLNLTRLPKSAQPSLVSIIFTLLGTLVYAAFSVYLIWDKLTGLFS